MNWYKKSITDDSWAKKVKDDLEKMLGLGKYKPDPSELKKKKKDDCECQHSMDMHCDGGDDGW